MGEARGLVALHSSSTRSPGYYGAVAAVVCSSPPQGTLWKNSSSSLCRMRGIQHLFAFLAIFGVEGTVKIEAATRSARLIGAAGIRAVYVTRAMASCAAAVCVLATDMRINTAFWFRGAGNFLGSALLAVIV